MLFSQEKVNNLQSLNNFAQKYTIIRFTNNAPMYNPIMSTRAPMPTSLQYSTERLSTNTSMNMNINIKKVDHSVTELLNQICDKQFYDLQHMHISQPTRSRVEKKEVNKIQSDVKINTQMDEEDTEVAEENIKSSGSAISYGGKMGKLDYSKYFASGKERIDVGCCNFMGKASKNNSKNSNTGNNNIK